MSKKQMSAIVVWGNQLSVAHNSVLEQRPDDPIIMIESLDMCRKFKYHKQKLWFVLTAMRDYRDELRAQGRTVWYSDLESAKPNWYDEFSRVCKEHSITEITAMRSSDRVPHNNLSKWCSENAIELTTTPNTLFLTPTAMFNEWAEDQTTLRMENFYRWQRKRLNILMDGAKPEGGKWNYDHENREPLPTSEKLPAIPKPTKSKHADVVKELVEKHFKYHPGTLDVLWLPTTRQAAEDWLKDFTRNRLDNFGIYEDAMRAGEPFIYHSLLSPLLNNGLLHPADVVAAATGNTKAPLAAREGFVRQIIGWREFMFGLYHHKPAAWKTSNYFNARKKLPEWWWKLQDAPEPPLDDALKRLEQYGYSHHIERLMIFGNYMLVSGYNPHEVYDWFMTMYIDAYEWVMVPNIIGMSQYADGGADNGGFATKPYISGSNYLQKMGKWWPSAAKAKESNWTKLYWSFLERNKDRLQDNYRLKPLLKRFENT